MVTLKDIHTIKVFLEEIEKEVIKRQELMMEAKQIFDEEAKEGCVDQMTLATLNITIFYYERALKKMELADEYAKAALRLYEFEEVLKKES